jgi:phosphoribosylformimino-5-aminoimidazole carboxamide ribotide isomerase
MERIPAIDILGGRCVQLVGGRLGTETFYGSPVETAKKWVSEGAEILHVVDLDATLGKGDNTKTLFDIKKSVKAPIQFGGGIRTVEKAKELLDKRIDRIILGTLAVNDYINGTGNLDEVIKAGGKDRVIVSIDSSGGFVVCKGWTEKTKIRTKDLINALEGKVWGFLYTNVDVEGQMKGVDMNAIEEVVKSTKKPVIVSGGISSSKDMKEIEKTGAWGVVLGRALYEGKIKLSD